MERMGDFAAVFRVVPEKEHALSQFFVRFGGGENFFSGLRMYAGIVNFCGKCHRCRSEILYLFEMEIQFFRLDGK